MRLKNGFQRKLGQICTLLILTLSLTNAQEGSTFTSGISTDTTISSTDSNSLTPSSFSESGTVATPTPSSETGKPKPTSPLTCDDFKDNGKFCRPKLNENSPLDDKKNISWSGAEIKGKSNVTVQLYVAENDETSLENWLNLSSGKGSLVIKLEKDWLKKHENNAIFLYLDPNHPVEEKKDHKDHSKEKEEELKKESKDPKAAIIAPVCILGGFLLILILLYINRRKRLVPKLSNNHGYGAGKSRAERLDLNKSSSSTPDDFEMPNFHGQGGAPYR